MASVTLTSLVKRYGQVTAVDGIDLAILDQELVVLVGPSGCGKSTTLRMIAGLEDISDGEIRIGTRVVNELEPKDRDIAMVFQDYALYPHMTVAENIGFGLRYRKVPRAEIERKVMDAARILGIEPLLARRPRELSGGQRQRVAMGRAIVRDPEVFLFDEPLSNLDAKLRVQMRTEIKKLHQRVATTMVYVTHDQVEAMTLADRIVIMKDGRIEQVGPPEQIYNHPATTYVAAFIGAPAMNLLPAMLEGQAGTAAVRLADGSLLPLPAMLAAAASGRQVTLGLRPEDLEPAEEGEPGLDLPVAVVEPLGADTLVLLDLAGQEITARLPPRRAPRVGERLRLKIEPARLRLFDQATGRAI